MSAIAMVLGCEPAMDDGEVALSERAGAGDCHPGHRAGVVGLDRVEVSGNPQVYGAFPTLFSNNVITLAGSYGVAGDVVSGGTVSITGGNRPDGDIVEYAGKVEADDPSAAVAAARVRNNNGSIRCAGGGSNCKSPLSGTALTLQAKQELTLSEGTYYFTSVSINGQAKLNVDGVVTIYLEGPATFNGGSAINPASDSLTIISAAPDELKFNGGGSTATHLYAPNATVRVSGDQVFKGSILGKQVHLSGNGGVETPSDVLTPLAGLCDENDRGGASEDGGTPDLPELPD